MPIPPSTAASAPGCGEYCYPFAGGPLGSTDRSWTAAVVLDWLC